MILVYSLGGQSNQARTKGPRIMVIQCRLGSSSLAASKRRGIMQAPCGLLYVNLFASMLVLSCVKSDQTSSRQAHLADSHTVVVPQLEFLQ